MAGNAQKSNYWTQEIGTQNGILKFGAMSPTGDVTASVQIVGVDGRHFIAMEEDGKRRYWTTMNAPGAFQINAGEDLVSSVLGLKASPHTATVFPVRSSPNLLMSLSSKICFCLLFRSSTAFRIWGSAPSSSIVLAKAFRSLGKQEPP